MDGIQTPLLAIAVAVAVACLLQFCLTAFGRTESMGPNRMVGIKTRATLASEAAWVAGHRAAQPALLAAGVTGLGAAGPIWLADASNEAGPTIAAAVVAVVVLALGGFAVHRANRAARSRAQRTSSSGGTAPRRA